MYRTDKQFMKDPATTASRIYIGNLSEKAVPDAVEEKFCQHGRILGLFLQRGYGFIQFEQESQAQSAIQAEHGSMFLGRKINVKQAVDTTKKNMNQFTNNNRMQQPGGMNQQGMNQQQKNEQVANKPPVPQVVNKPGPPPLMKQNLQPPQIQKPPPMQNKPQVQNQPQVQKQPPPQQVSVPAPPVLQQQENAPPMDDGMLDKRKRKKPKLREYSHDYHDEMRPPYYEPYAPAPAYHMQPPILERPERNDCEIIVVSKALTEYAEYIEQRLKSLGLIVDLLFPNEDVPIGRVLANISSRGCLYAILVMPQNEEHRSLTLNILHGIPEEHRNMPTEDAFVLITRNFEMYMRGEKGANGHDPDKMTLTTRHPEHIQVILNLLAENRQINTNQYDRLVVYLKEKRDMQSAFEITEGIDTGIEPEAKTKQTELQSRIMNILNKKAEEPKVEVKVAAVTPAAAPSSNSAPLLKDPSVQKALDSLLLGDMFKGLSA